jgi:hypothetical protein
MSAAWPAPSGRIRHRSGSSSPADWGVPSVAPLRSRVVPLLGRLISPRTSGLAANGQYWSLERSLSVQMHVQDGRCPDKGPPKGRYRRGTSVGACAGADLSDDGVNSVRPVAARRVPESPPFHAQVWPIHDGCNPLTSLPGRRPTSDQSTHREVVSSARGKPGEVLGRVIIALALAPANYSGRHILSRNRLRACGADDDATPERSTSFGRGQVVVDRLSITDSR